MIQFSSQIPYSLGWSVLGFLSVFLYQILNRYLFGIIFVSIIIIILFLLVLLFRNI